MYEKALMLAMFANAVALLEMLSFDSEDELLEDMEQVATVRCPIQFALTKRCSSQWILMWLCSIFLSTRSISYT